MSKNRKYKSRLYGAKETMPCEYCLIPLNFEEATVEHMIRKADGGTNRIENLTIACKKCNNEMKYKQQGE